MQPPSYARREIGLLARCGWLFLSGGDLNGLQAALAHPIDWPEFERAADHHSMMPLAAYVLKQHGGDLVPQEVLERMEERLHLTARRNLLWLAEWQRVLPAFESAGTRAISLKGPAFALLAYGNIALRESTDLDFLVSPGDAPRARDALLDIGYRLRFPAVASLRSRNRQLEFINPERGTSIDLHWGAVHAMFPFQLPVEVLFQSARVEQQDGMSFLSLSPEYLLLYLCAHGTKHCWLQLRWLCDVACFLTTARAPNWDLCIMQAEAARCGLVLKHSLLLARQVLNLELPSDVKDYCECAEARTLADTASSFLFREDDTLSRGKALRYHLAFAAGWSDSMRLVFERIFVPEEQDWQKVRLPHSLRLAYYAVRPMRFMLDRF